MMKRFIVLILFFLLLSGCGDKKNFENQSAIRVDSENISDIVKFSGGNDKEVVQPIFNKSDFISNDVSSSEILSVDLNGDRIKEQVILSVDGGVQRFRIISYYNNEWHVDHDETVKDSADSSYRSIVKIEPMNFSPERKSHLLIHTKVGESNSAGFFVFGYYDGMYGKVRSFVKIDRDPGKYLKKREQKLVFKSVEVAKEGVLEVYSVYCSKTKICRDLRVLHRYGAESFVPEELL